MGATESVDSCIFASFVRDRFSVQGRMQSSAHRSYGRSLPAVGWETQREWGRILAHVRLEPPAPHAAQHRGGRAHVEVLHGAGSADAEHARSGRHWELRVLVLHCDLAEVGIVIARKGGRVGRCPGAGGGDAREGARRESRGVHERNERNAARDRARELPRSNVGGEVGECILKRP